MLRASLRHMTAPGACVLGGGAGYEGWEGGGAERPAAAFVVNYYIKYAYNII